MRRQPRPTDTLRQSQLITTFGPGAMVDLPEHSVMIGGLESWQGAELRIHEERLETWLRDRLQIPELTLRAPPVDEDDSSRRRTGVTAYQFPAWFLAQIDDATWRAPDGRIYRTRPLIRYDQLVSGKYLDENRKKRSVVPVRFVQACVRGHISDIDWYAFVRRDSKSRTTGLLWFDEGGSGNDFAEIFVRDDQTGARRPLSDASIPNTLGRCSGRQPWLGPDIYESCDECNRLLTRSASNAYFAQTMGVIAIPDGDAALREAVDAVYEDFLQYCEDEHDVERERRKERVKVALEGLTDAAVWAEVARRNAKIEAPQRGVKEVEIETLLSQKEALGEDLPGGDFYARSAPLGPLPKAAEGKVEKLVLVHRLREVVAQVGFTRFEASFPGIDGELDLNVERASLAREVTWLPAYQNRGEGIFIAFSEAAIEAWLNRPGVKAREAILARGHALWSEEKGRNDAFSGLPYMMLHSLAHLLITALALDCGYAASSIRERVYAGENGYGILLYTGASGAEGTLGGLVDMGKHIGRHLKRALELGRLCSNDPVCSQHEPTSDMDERHLHGAACHGCLLIAETSCERRNDLLDRALVVPTVGCSDAAFFGEP